jgi:hypothetical protein
MPPKPLELTLSEEELLALVKGGAKITALPDEEPEPPPGPTDAEQIVAAIKALGASIANRSVPDVKVAGANVTVRPAITVEQPVRALRKFKFRVTERDNTERRNIVAFEAEEFDVKP